MPLSALIFHQVAVRDASRTSPPSMRVVPACIVLNIEILSQVVQGDESNDIMNHLVNCKIFLFLMKYKK